MIDRLANSIDTLNEWVGRTVAWLVLGMVAVTFLVVVLRYGLEFGRRWMQESITYMHALVFMLGAAYTLKRDGHVRVDIFYRRLGPRGRAWVDLLGALLLLLPTCIFIGWVSWDYVASAWTIREGSPEPGGLPGVFLIKTAIPVMAVLLGLQGLSQVLHALRVILGHDSAMRPQQPGSEPDL